MSSPVSNTDNNNTETRLNPNAEVYTRLIKEKHLRDDVQFF